MEAKHRIRTAALKLFMEDGYEATSVAKLCRQARVSNGSFFHAYPTKEALGGDLWLTALEHYHATVTLPLQKSPNARDGIRFMIGAHLEWVVTSKPMAKLLFEQVRSEWLIHIRDRQVEENQRFAASILAWRDPLVKSGKLAEMSQEMFTAQLIGPAQIFCRAWLAGRSGSDPRKQAPGLIECAWRALQVAPDQVSPAAKKQSRS